MNTQLARAIDAVKNANKVAQRLAGRTVDEATRMVSIQDDNRDFNQAIGSAQTQLEAALDEVEGQTQTKVEYALDAVKRARGAYYVPVASNRLNAADATREAVRHMPEGLTVSND